MRCLGFSLLFILLNCFAGRAQHTSIPVEVVVEKLQHKDIRSFLEKSTEAVFKFYHDTVVQENYLAESCIIVNSKQEERTIDLSNDAEFKQKRNLKPFAIPSTSTSIILKMENYEDDKGEVCIHDKGDDHFYISSLQINLAEVNAGVFSKSFNLISEKEKYAAVVKVRYGIPKPDDIIHINAEEVTEVTKPITLQSDVKLINKKGLTYQWEYNIAGEDKWHALGQPTLTASVVFIPGREIFKTPIKANQKVKLRVKAISAEIHSEFSMPIEVAITPEAPKFIPADVSLIPSCPNKNSGTVAISSIISPADSLQYIIIEGKVPVFTSVEDVLSKTVRKQGIVPSAGVFTVNDLDNGDYTLFIHNAVGAVGKAGVAHAFSITEFPVLEITDVILEEASCDSSNNGRITVNTKGGNPHKLSYFIDPPLGDRTVLDRNVVFSQLPAGVYAVVIEDECGQHLSKKSLEVLRKAMPLMGEVAQIIPAASETSNGSVKLKVYGGTGMYDYVMTNAGATVKEGSLDNALVIGDLPAGSFNLKITDKTYTCASWDTLLVIPQKTQENSQQIPAEGSSPTDSVSLNYFSNQPSIGPNFTVRDKKLDFYGTSNKSSVSFAAFKDNSNKDDYTIVVEKGRYTMSILDNMGDTVIIYPVVFGNNDQDDKLIQGDRKTPEGEYEIIEKRDHDKWSKIMMINYPNAADQNKFAERKKKGLIPADARIGDAIAIHGTRDNEDYEIDRQNNWTDGCVATKNKYMEQIFKYIPVGTRVIIKK